MRVPPPVDSTLQGLVDWTAGTFLLSAFARLATILGAHSARRVRIAAAVPAGYRTLTAYPLGMVGLVPFQVPVEQPNRTIHDGSPAVRRPTAREGVAT